MINLGWKLAMVLQEKAAPDVSGHVVCTWFGSV